MPTEIIHVCFGIQIMEDSPCFPVWTTDSREISIGYVDVSITKNRKRYPVLI